jgi:CheY-like chemotaxis protein
MRRSITSLTAAKGLEQVQMQRFDLIISDISMLQMDNYQFTLTAPRLPTHKGEQYTRLGSLAFSQSEDWQEASIPIFGSIYLNSSLLKRKLRLFWALQIQINLAARSFGHHVSSVFSQCDTGLREKMQPQNEGIQFYPFSAAKTTFAPSP